MAKDIKFNIRLSVDGKEQLVTATADVKELRDVMSAARAAAKGLQTSLINLNQSVQAFQNATSAVAGIGDQLKTYSQSMAKAAQLTGLTGDELRKMRNEAQAVADVYGEDMGSVLQSANALAKAFGISAGDAMQLLRGGMAGGANANGEFIDTLKEYPRYFKEAGMSAEDFVAITANAAKQGIFSDKGVDAVKEANLRIREMTTATAAALDGIGISSGEVQRQLQSGATTTFAVMQQVAEKLKTLPASASVVGTAIADIFGGPGEDAGLEYLKSLADIELSMDKVKASADDYSKSLAESVDRQAAMTDGLTGLIDLSKVFETVAPLLDISAQLGMTAAGVQSVVGLMTTLNITSKATAVAVKAANVALAMTGTSVTRLQAGVRVLTAALKGGAYQATALKIALRGLLTATAVGAAIAALSVVLGKFTAKADEASDKADSLKDAQDAYTTAAADAKTTIETETNKLGGLIKANADTSDAVAHLNETYGDIFGTHKTAAEWYDTLTAKSKAYVEQIGYEAQAKVLASKLAEKQIRLEQNAARQRELVQSGKARESVTQYSGSSITGNVTSSTYERDTKAYKALKEEAAALTPEIAELQQQLDIAKSHMADLTPTATPAVPKVKAVADEVADTAKPETELAWKEEASTIREITANIKILEERLQDAGADEAATLNRQIAAWKEKREAIQQAGLEQEKAAAMPEPKTDARSEAYARGINEGKLYDYNAARGKASDIMSMLDAGIIDDEEAQRQVDAINAELARIGDGIKPITLDVDTKQTESKLGDAADAVEKLGSSFGSMGKDLDIPELNIAGTIGQAIATIAQGYANATAEAGKLGPLGWIAFASTGLVQMLSMIASVKSATEGYATGGIVGGTSTSGDRKLIRVNSGEMILNRWQQSNLFRMLNGGVGMPDVQPMQPQQISLNVGNLSDRIGTGTDDSRVEFVIDGRTLRGVLNKEDNIRRRG